MGTWLPIFLSNIIRNQISVNQINKYKVLIMANNENIPNDDRQESNSPAVPFFVRYLEGQLEDLSEEESKSIGGGFFGGFGRGIFGRFGIFGRLGGGVCSKPVTRKYPSDNDEGVDAVTLKFPSDDEEGVEITTLKFPSDNEDI